jgi:two-component system nitrogen regulation sensor histidine kinase NtrY
MDLHLGIAGVAVMLAGAAAAAVTLAVALRLRARLGVAQRQGEGWRRALTEGTAEAQRREALLRAVVETTPVAVVVFADDGEIVFTNEAARQLFFDGAEVAGQNFVTMLERAPAPLRRALESDEDDLVTVERDGEAETFYVSKRPLEAEGRSHILVAVRPVTQPVARQEIATLKRVIRIIGHEASNSLGPMVSLMASARLMLAQPEPARRLQPLLETVEERAQHLQKFLSGYGELARLPPPAPVLVDWRPFLDGLRGLWSRVKVGGAPAAPGYFDRGQIQQVVINLVKNALEAGGPEDEVRLEVAPGGDEGHGVRVTVFDRGQGMSDEVMRHAVLPFFSTKPKGSGLGLALCREIIEQHRGRLRLARRAEGGMAISFWLPDRDVPLSRATAESRVRLGLTRS